jgi:hypothetical protein
MVEMVDFTVRHTRFTTGFIKDKSIFSQANSLITVNVIKEDKTFGRAITKQ